MRRLVVLLASAAALAAAAPAPASSPVATPSSNAAGARDVTLTVTVSMELQCGRPMGGRTLSLTLPRAARVAASIPASAVTVGGRAVASVARSGRTLRLTLARPRGMMCDSIRTGPLRIVLLPAAGFRNPAKAGVYVVRVAHGADSFAARLTIR
jgi:hypothetical protein